MIGCDISSCIYAIIGRVGGLKNNEKRTGFDKTKLTIPRHFKSLKAFWHLTNDIFRISSKSKYIIKALIDLIICFPDRTEQEL